MDVPDELTRLALSARDTRDPWAVEEFIRAIQGDVWRLCAHLGDRDRADDMAQDCFVRILKSLRTFRGDAPVRPWVFTIVRRVVADDIAARQRRRREPVDRAARVVPDHQGTVALELLLEGLDPDRREAFVLTQIVGFSYADAAEVVGCPIGTIRSRVARAREDLVRSLDLDRGADRREA